MKNLITVLTIITITFSTAFANTAPEVIISTTDVEVVTVTESDIFTNASFDASSESMSFDTTRDMAVVQIFNEEGTMEFQLPVMSDNVQINKNLFDKGTYKLGFVLAGQTQVHFTEVTIK